MQFSENRIAEIFDYSRFEPSEAMGEIVSCFAEKYNLAWKKTREKVTFDELSGEKAAKSQNRLLRTVFQGVPKRKTTKNCDKLLQNPYKLV